MAEAPAGGEATRVIIEEEEPTSSSSAAETTVQGAWCAMVSGGHLSLLWKLPGPWPLLARCLTAPSILCCASRASGAEAGPATAKKEQQGRQVGGRRRGQRASRQAKIKKCVWILVGEIMQVGDAGVQMLTPVLSYMPQSVASSTSSVSLATGAIRTLSAIAQTRQEGRTIENDDSLYA